MSRVYLAARYGRREEVLAHAVELADDGHTVTSRWLLGNQQWDAPTLAAAVALEERGETPPEAARFAIEDWADLRTSEVVILFTEPPGSTAGTRGGRHVEFGMAYALGKRCLVVGGRENVFHLLPGVEHHPTWERARRRLRWDPDGPETAAAYSTTTERSTSPLPIFAKASSTPSSGMVSDTNRSRSSIPRR